MVIRSAYGKSDALVVSNGGHFSAQVFGLIGDASEIQEGTRGGGGSKTLNVCRYDSILAIASAPESCVVRRSEEHTSELQSLMRNSYAVFCLKKKNTT